jgi:murein DD-endopeptidase MepM/ murein hydrolase activator NlpD
MTDRTPHISLRLVLRLIVPVLLLTILGSFAPAIAQRSSAGTRAAGAAHSYGWPVKPFDRQHPVRGSFGDPRTLFTGPPTHHTLLSGDGSFSFHFGIDVAAPDGTAVYPVESGIVTAVTDEWVGVDGANGRSFQYWHIAAAVRVGNHVEADSTVLGRILRGCGHVHLAELDNGVTVNPLAPGHLRPYRDVTAPAVTSVVFRRAVSGDDLMPELLRGRIEIIAAARDMPTLPVPGEWHDLPVTPSLVEWRVQSAATRRIVVPTHVAFDVRRRLPAKSAFWQIYARGTYQNMCVFGKHYSYMQPGAYLFRLTPTGLDTRLLRDEVYELVVTAFDIRGNHTSLAVRFSVHNRPGVVGK